MAKKHHKKVPCDLNDTQKIVLLVDDDTDVLESIATVLEIETEHQILTASSKAEVKALLKEHTPDIALLDIQLGQESGLDLIPILRAHSDDMICTMVTAHRDVDYAVKAVKLGANEYLFKPIDPLKVIEHINDELCIQHMGRLKEDSEREELYRSKCDPLTGLPGRALLNHHFSVTLSSAARTKSSFSVLFLDLDHFKELNDTLGHQTGDELLIEAAKQMRSALRDEEILARIGGDEFVIVLREGSSIESVINVAERLIKKIESIPMKENQIQKVTTSIGIASYPQDGSDISTLLENADQAMYRAKKSGKNNYSF